MKHKIEIKNAGRYPGAIHLVASARGKPVGRIDTSQVGKTSIIEGFVVQKPYRQQGIGSQMLRRAERLAKKQGASRIESSPA